MAIIIRNREGYHISHDSNGKLIKVKNIMQAEDFLTLQKAIEQMKCTSGKTKGYYVYDTITCRICYGNTKEISNYVKRKKRKQYSKAVRKMLYDKAEGRCQLCGRALSPNEVTLDHIIPLALGGVDDESNLQISCHICNYAKNVYLPDEFQDRIFDTLCYQMEKKYGKSLKWKFVHRLLVGMI